MCPLPHAKPSIPRSGLPAHDDHVRRHWRAIIDEEVSRVSLSTVGSQAAASGWSGPRASGAGGGAGGGSRGLCKKFLISSSIKREF